MWSPGTFVLAAGGRAINILEHRDFFNYDVDVRPRFALVLSCIQTGYGTRGYKWDVLVLTNGLIVTIKNAHKVENLFAVQAIT